MGKLYGIVAGTKDTFKLGVQVVDKAVVFTRVEERYSLPRNKFTGYREQFLQMYTRRQIEAKSGFSHHCVLRYMFGGLTFLVRTNLDAFLPQDESEAPNADEKSENLTRFVAQNKDLGMSTSNEAHPKVIVQEGGQYVPHTAFAEIITRAKCNINGLDIKRKMPGFWYGQTQFGARVPRKRDPYAKG